ncbi:MAG: sulfate transporter CysZ [Coxiellaceae bacterium]|nr:sulfate transporter CysZ [Coxiellaceae bacterium]
MSNNPLSGFHYLLKGFAQLNRKGIKRFVYIPMAINVVIYCVVLAIAGHYFTHLTHWIISKIPSWLDWLTWILWPLFVITAGLFIIYTFVILANLVGAPFNTLLSEKLEQLETGHELNPDEGLFDSIKDIPRSIKRQLIIIGYTIPRVVIILLLFFVPGVNIFMSFIWFAFSAWIMALQYVDYPMDLHRISFSDMRQHMRQSFLKYFSFGCCVTIAMLIPILNFFAMPAAVIGATLMFLDERSVSQEVNQT